MIPTPSRDEEIRLIWKENQWLYMVVGFIAGLLFCLFTQLSVLDLPELVQSLIPEAAGILVTITVIDQLNRRRDERNKIKELQDELVRDASSIVNDVANNAVHQLRKREWLKGNNGLLKGANLIGANLFVADLSGAKLQKANLWDANLQDANLREANLQEANLFRAKLKGANLSFAKLQKANLSIAKLQEANLWMANLQGANLEAAKLEGANFHTAKLEEANLAQANLQGAYLFRANLQGANLEDVEFDETTILPDGSNWTPATDMTRFTQPDNESG